MDCSNERVSYIITIVVLCVFFIQLLCLFACHLFGCVHIFSDGEDVSLRPKKFPQGVSFADKLRPSWSYTPGSSARRRFRRGVWQELAFGSGTQSSDPTRDPVRRSTTSRGRSTAKSRSGPPATESSPWRVLRGSATPSAPGSDSGISRRTVGPEEEQLAVIEYAPEAQPAVCRVLPEEPSVVEPPSQRLDDVRCEL